MLASGGVEAARIDPTPPPRSQIWARAVWAHKRRLYTQRTHREERVTARLIKRRNCSPPAFLFMCVCACVGACCDVNGLGGRKGVGGRGVNEARDGAICIMARCCCLQRKQNENILEGQKRIAGSAFRGPSVRAHESEVERKKRGTVSTQCAHNSSPSLVRFLSYTVRFEGASLHRCSVCISAHPQQKLGVGR